MLFNILNVTSHTFLIKQDADTRLYLLKLVKQISNSSQITSISWKPGTISMDDGVRVSEHVGEVCVCVCVSSTYSVFHYAAGVPVPIRRSPAVVGLRPAVRSENAKACKCVTF